MHHRRIDIYFSWGIPEALDNEKLLTAASLLLASFPALGSRLDLSSAPALQLQPPAFPLSFAEWPAGTSDQLFGLHALPPLPTPPIYDAMEVYPQSSTEAHDRALVGSRHWS